MRCKVCGSKKIKQDIFQNSFDFAEDKILTSINKCLSCGSYFRDVDFSAPDIITHFDGIGYTQDWAEKWHLRTRKKFYYYLFNLIQEQTDKNLGLKLLDVGCSYGIMMEIFKKQGIIVSGVEILKRLRERLCEKGFTIYEKIDDTKDGLYDVVTCIDSLDYFQNPLDELKKINSILINGGLLLVRITNHTPLLNIYYHLKKKIPSVVFGDRKFAFSTKGIEILLKNTGFRVIIKSDREKGKKIEFGKRWFFNHLTPIISSIIGIPIAPGLIILAKKKDRNK